MNTMMTGSERDVPATLREQVLADLRPVRPLAEPWRRALLLLPVGLVLMAAVHLRWGTRADLGGLLLWGLSLLQLGVGVCLVIAALREVIPDRSLSVPLSVVLFGSGFGLAIAATYLAWQASPTIAPETVRYLYWKFCFTHTIEIGLPVLLFILLLAARGVIWRPGLVGALAGLGAGLIADAGWRSFCNVSEPGHVLSAHVAGVVALTILGASLAFAWASTTSRFKNR